MSNHDAYKFALVSKGVSLATAKLVAKGIVATDERRERTPEQISGNQ